MGTRSRFSDHMSIIGWNVWVGANHRRIRIQLFQWIKEFNPEIFVLIEAKNLYGHLEGLGYQVVQMKSSPKRPGNEPGDANVAILVRNDVKLKRSFAQRMKTFWIGPKHGWKQDPRINRWVLVKKPGKGQKTWKIGGAHTPFGEKARSESRRRLVKWLKNTLPGRPTVLIIDANMHLEEFEETIAEPGGAEATGRGIDLEAHKKCRIMRKENLGKGVSDHPAKFCEFRAL